MTNDKIKKKKLKKLTRVYLSHHIVESLKNTSSERIEHDNFSSSNLSQNQT